MCAIILKSSAVPSKYLYHLCRYRAKDISRGHLGAQDIYGFHLGKLYFYLKHHLLWVLRNICILPIYIIFILATSNYNIV